MRKRAALTAAIDDAAEEDSTNAPSVPAAAAELSSPPAPEQSSPPRATARRLSAKAEAAIAPVRRRMRAAAYSLGGVDWAKLFLQYDKSGDGGLQLSELQSAVRRVLPGSARISWVTCSARKDRA